jgi:hypothetical protein
MKQLTKFITAFIIGGITASTASCVTSGGAHHIARGVVEYCNNVDTLDRQAMRRAVNDELSTYGHSVLVSCGGGQ